MKHETVADQSWLVGLATSMTQELDYAPVVQGQLPAGLRGTLYRNGPGRFELGGVRKRHLLDGDGMIQAFDFSDGAVRYRNRFVRTEKFQKEQQAGRLQFPTWTTRAPGGMWANMGHNMLSQAGVTTLVKNGCLYAFDEVGLPYGLDPGSLETRGEQAVGPAGLKVDYKAHTKTDARTGDWALLSFEHGLRNYVHLVEHAADMSLKRHQRIPVPRSSYIHDWFLTERYALVLLHPVMLSLTRYLSGYASFTDSLRWQPEQGNLLLVVDRSGAQKPLLLDAPACFMWHSLNAYEQGDTIVADFVGYQQPDHFLGEHAAFHAIMQGQQGVQQASGQLQRYVVNFKQRHLSLEILSTSNCEFPMLDLRMATRPHRFGYCTTASGPTVFHHGLMRIDTDTGQQDVADMGDATHLGEPVFVSDDSAREDSGHLLSVGLDGASGNSFLAVFRADRLSDGPLARVWLTHPTPLSFHGYWHAA